MEKSNGFYFNKQSKQMDQQIEIPLGFQEVMNMDEKFQSLVGITENGIIGFINDKNQTDLYEILQDHQGKIIDFKKFKTFNSILKVLVGKQDKLICCNEMYQKEQRTKEWVKFYTFPIPINF